MGRAAFADDDEREVLERLAGRDLHEDDGDLEDDDPYEGDEDEDIDGDDDLDDDDVDREALDFFSEHARPMTVEDTVGILAAAQTEQPSFLRGGKILLPTGAMRCRVCHCTEERACAGGCFWAAPNLCCRCVA